jgi:RNA polymerase sigma-70 factor (ECF subfamily)
LEATSRPEPGGDRAHATEDDLDLVGSARGGDARALDVLIARMRQIARILAVLNVRLGAPLSADDLADVAQDTAARAWSKLEHFDGTSSLETWFCGIARRELMNALRRKRKHRSAAELEDAPEPDARGADVDAERLRLALDKLDDEDARMIALHHFEDLTLEQAAQRLGVPLSTAKRRYYRGLASLHRFLAGRLAAE